MDSNQLTAVSLFSGGGIGDLALKTNNIRVLVANELLTDRAAVFSHNFPSVKMFTGEIQTHKQKISSATQDLLAGKELDILFATPPCQGMSKNGRGKLLQRLANGERVVIDPRNRLFLHAVEIAQALQPRILVFENVPEMRNTLVYDESGKLRPILEIASEMLGEQYTGAWEVVEFADYGVPQRRQRLITTFTRDALLQSQIDVRGSLLPLPTHSQQASNGSLPWITVNQALEGVPSLDASCRQTAQSELAYHRVPTLDSSKYFWVSNTPPGRGAFDNQCVNTGCMFEQNQLHSAKRNRSGINQASKDTPIRCEQCQELLPRPWVLESTGQYRLMSGYTSAYKRMRGDRPASALTRNLSYACSDHKIHPTENRVLSLYEAFIIHTVSDYHFEWHRADNKKLSDKTVREIIGESIPPRGLAKIFRAIAENLRGQTQPMLPSTSMERPAQASLPF